MSKEVTFNISDDMYDKFVDIKERSESLKKEEVLNNAINLYGWYLDNAAHGNDLYLYKGELFKASFDFCGENATVLLETLRLVSDEHDQNPLPIIIRPKWKMVVIAVLLIVNILLIRG
jgi:hypothetical protein